MTNPASEPAWPDNRDYGHDFDYQDTTYTCELCGDEFESWADDYCGKSFMETEKCRRCAEDDGRPDPMGGWDEDQGRDR